MSFHAGLHAHWTALPPFLQKALLLALTLVVGLVAIRLLRRYIGKLLGRVRGIDETLRRFLVAVAGTGGWVILLVILLVMAGVDLTALLGGLAIGGFVIGFALKDTLGNLAAGVMLLLYRPFSVGEVITLEGEIGTVERLGMALTTLRAADGRLVTIPNGTALGGKVINHTREPLRRADVAVGIGYNDDLQTAIAAILDAVQAHAGVRSDPAPTVVVMGLGADAVDLQVRPWVATADYWRLQAELRGVVKDALMAKGIDIPYPQRVVHMVGPSP